jgi:hypothetical protein
MNKINLSALKINFDNNKNPLEKTQTITEPIVLEKLEIKEPINAELEKKD